MTFLTDDEAINVYLARAQIRSLNGNGAPWAAVYETIAGALAREQRTARLLQDQTLTCACVAEHRPPPLELHRHHVWPLALGGPDVEDNLIDLCPTTHASVHVVLRNLLRYGVLTRHETQDVIPGDRVVAGYAHDVALHGYRSFIENGLAA